MVAVEGSTYVKPTSPSTQLTDDRQTPRKLIEGQGQVAVVAFIQQAGICKERKLLDRKEICKLTRILISLYIYGHLSFCCGLAQDLEKGYYQELLAFILFLKKQTKAAFDFSSSVGREKQCVVGGGLRSPTLR